MSNIFSNISPKAKIGKGVKIESFVSIGDDVEIGDNCWIGSNVSIMDGARIGNNCKIFPGAVISAIPQDLKFDGEKSIVKIGDNTTSENLQLLIEQPIIAESLRLVKTVSLWLMYILHMTATSQIM